MSAKAVFVKKAQKDNPVAKKGESYWWWKFRYGGIHYSKERPRQSQLENSPFLSGIRALEERLEDLSLDGTERDADGIQSEVEDIISEIRSLGDECQEKLDNMPEGLQQGSSGELLQERVDECESMASELESISFDDYDGPDVPKEENGEGPTPEEFTDWIENKLEEVQNVSYGGS